MVRKTNYRKRFAFTMIELIFAIVIIAISVLSLPMMTQVTGKGIESNILQEAVFAASAELMGATAGYWDLNSMEDNNFSNMSRVIDVGGTCLNNITDTRHRLRPGHIAQLRHRRCVDSTTGNIANASDTTFPNLNNAVHGGQLIFTDATTDATGYKESYNSAVSIVHEDEAGNVNNNIKKITITITDTQVPPNTITILRTYSANIGEIDYYKRTML